MNNINLYFLNKTMYITLKKNGSYNNNIDNTIDNKKNIGQIGGGGLPSNNCVNNNTCGIDDNDKEVTGCGNNSYE